MKEGKFLLVNSRSVSGWQAGIPVPRPVSSTSQRFRPISPHRPLVENSCFHIKTVSASLGHYSVAFTMDKYGHVSNTMKRAASVKMGQYIDTLNLTTV